MAKIPIPEYRQSQAPGVAPAMPRGSAVPVSSASAEAAVQLGRVTQDALVKFQQDNNQTAVDDAYNNNFSPAFRELYHGYYTTQGKDALDQRPDYEAKMQELRTQVRDGLGSDAQRRLFDDISRRRVEGELDGMARHAATQRITWLKQTSDATLDNYSQDAADKWNDETKFAGALQSGLAEVDRYGRAHGHSSEMIRARGEAFVSKAWTQRLERVMLNDPLAARDLYAAHQTEIDAATRPVLEHKLKVAVKPVYAQAIADHAMTGADMAGLSDAIEKSDGRLLRVVLGAQSAAALDAPLKAKDTRAAMGEWMATGDAAARRMAPNDPQLADMVRSVIHGRVATIAQAQEAVQKQKQGVLLDMVVKAKPNGIDDLLRQPGARDAWNGLDPQAQLAIIHLTGRNAEGDNIKTKPAVFMDVLHRIHADEGDPNKIRSGTELVKFVGQGLSFNDYQRLQHEYDRMQTPEGNRFLRDVQGARVAARRIMGAGMAGNLLRETQPDRFEAAAQSFAADLDAKIEEYRKAGKDARDLITPGKPDYVLTPERVGSYLRDPRAVVSDAAAKAGAPKAAAPIAIKTDAEYAALPKNTLFVGPDGVQRRKP